MFVIRLSNRVHKSGKLILIWFIQKESNTADILMGFKFWHLCVSKLLRELICVELIICDNLLEQLRSNGRLNYLSI